MRPHVLVSLFAVAVAAAAACATAPTPPTPEPDPDEMSEAEQYFTEHLAPVFKRDCASCHASASDTSPDFLGTSGAEADFYDVISTWPGFVTCEPVESPLLTKGQDPTHPGASFQTADAPKVFQWLEIEMNVAFPGGEGCLDPSTSSTTGGGTGGSGGGGGTGGSGGGGEPVTPGWPPVSGADHMKAFGDCMTYADWIATGMPLVTKETALHQGNNVQCEECHGGGQNTGLNYMPDPNLEDKVKDAFQIMRYMFHSMNLVRWTTNDDGSFKELVPSYRWRDAGSAGSGHAPYTLDQEYVATLENWWALSKGYYDEAIATGVRCDPALGDPPP